MVSIILSSKFGRIFEPRDGIETRCTHITSLPSSLLYSLEPRDGIETDAHVGMFLLILLVVQP